MKLSRLHRQRAFEIARYAVAKAKGDKTLAEKIVNEESHKLGLDPLLLSLLLQLALYFVKKWMDKQTALMMGEDVEEIPTEYTDEIEAEVLAAFPEQMAPGKL